MFFSRFMLFPTLLDKIIFRVGGGGVKKLWCLLLNLVAGDLGRQSCLVLHEVTQMLWWLFCDKKFTSFVSLYSFGIMLSMLKFVINFASVVDA